MAGLGVPEILVIFGIIVLMFGGKKLPELGGAIGEAIRNFRGSVREPEQTPVPAPTQVAKIEAKQPEPAAKVDETPSSGGQAA